MTGLGALLGLLLLLAVLQPADARSVVPAQPRRSKAAHRRTPPAPTAFEEDEDDDDDAGSLSRISSSVNSGANAEEKKKDAKEQMEADAEVENDCVAMIGDIEGMESLADPALVKANIDSAGCTKIYALGDVFDAKNGNSLKKIVNNVANSYTLVYGNRDLNKLRLMREFSWEQVETMRSMIANGKPACAEAILTYPMLWAMTSYREAQRQGGKGYVAQVMGLADPEKTPNVCTYLTGYGAATYTKTMGVRGGTYDAKTLEWESMPVYSEGDCAKYYGGEDGKFECDNSTELTKKVWACSPVGLTWHFFTHNQDLKKMMVGGHAMKLDGDILMAHSGLEERRAMHWPLLDSPYEKLFGDDLVLGEVVGMIDQQVTDDVKKAWKSPTTRGRDQMKYTRETLDWGNTNCGKFTDQMTQLERNIAVIEARNSGGVDAFEYISSFQEITEPGGPHVMEREPDKGDLAIASSVPYPMRFCLKGNKGEVCNPGVTTNNNVGFYISLWYQQFMDSTGVTQNDHLKYLGKHGVRVVAAGHFQNPFPLVIRLKTRTGQSPVHFVGLDQSGYGHTNLGAGVMLTERNGDQNDAEVAKLHTVSSVLVRQGGKRYVHVRMKVTPDGADGEETLHKIDLDDPLVGLGISHARAHEIKKCMPMLYQLLEHFDTATTKPPRTNEQGEVVNPGLPKHWVRLENSGIFWVREMGTNNFFITVCQGNVDVGACEPFPGSRVYGMRGMSADDVSTLEGMLTDRGVRCSGPERRPAYLEEDAAVQERLGVLRKMATKQAHYRAKLAARGDAEDELNYWFS